MLFSSSGAFSPDYTNRTMKNILNCGMEIKCFATERRQEPRFWVHLSQKYTMSNEPDIKDRFCIITSFQKFPRENDKSPNYVQRFEITTSAQKTPHCCDVNDSVR